MKNKSFSNLVINGENHYEELFELVNAGFTEIPLNKNKQSIKPKPLNELAEILVITSYPPRECGIATYSEDLIKALNHKFGKSFSIRICALESGEQNFSYHGDVIYTLKTSIEAEYEKLADKINNNTHIKIVCIQHEFGFYSLQEKAFVQFLNKLIKPVVTVFHTVLPHPDEQLKLKIKSIAAVCKSIIVMTHNSARILSTDYGVPEQKISVIAHGTHLVPHLNEKYLKAKYDLANRKVLSTFGLLSSGKSIETTIDALPAIVKECPEVMFLVMGKTHPEVVKTDGEKYRKMLEQKVISYGLQKNVRFINKYLSLHELLEYLQLTDIYLFTSNDPNQAVSGTFAYAMSCGCPIISTPIPHAKEVLTSNTGIIFDFCNSEQLGAAVIRLLKDDELRMTISTNSLQKIVSTAWENSAVAHAELFSSIMEQKIDLRYNIPPLNLDHFKLMTTNFGMIQFAKINQPDISTGYTLDDNARALVAICLHFEETHDDKDLGYIQKYLDFIQYCQKPAGDFYNYVDENIQFTIQNEAVNLDDSNGRAVWALGFLISLSDILPSKIISETELIIQKAIQGLGEVHSPRAMAFAVKGLYYYYRTIKSPEILDLIKIFSNRLVDMYRHESGDKWNWFEGYLTYANSIMPEAMIYAWLLTGETVYRGIAIASFDFLLSKIFNENGIEVISNKKWLLKGEKAGHFGEQPIDVAYTIMTLAKYYDVFGDEEYRNKMQKAFNWFLGDNRLNQIVYNPCTGGCYDGMEENNVNLNQGAESTVSYLMARLTIEKYKI